jgi:hypothetical protein
MVKVVGVGVGVGVGEIGVPIEVTDVVPQPAMPARSGRSKRNPRQCCKVRQSNMVKG